jgi:hypothetical protein
LTEALLVYGDDLTYCSASFMLQKSLLGNSG